MPSVGSTPTTTSPALVAAVPGAGAQQQQQQQPQQPQQHLQQQPPQHQNATPHPKLQQKQHSLPLQLQYNNNNHQNHHQHPSQQQQQYHHQQYAGVTTTQPSPAGTTFTPPPPYHSRTPTLSASQSFSSIDTNQTLLHAIQTQQCPATTTPNQRAAVSNPRAASYHAKYAQFMIITPAVSIDRDFETETNTARTTDNSPATYFNTSTAATNGNNAASAAFRMSLDSSGGGGRHSRSSSSDGESAASSFRSHYNPYLHHSRQHLLPKTSGGRNASPHFYTFSASSWRWCTLICAAMRCFGAGARGGGNSQAPYSSFAGRPPYQRSRSSGGASGGYSYSSQPHRRLRPSSSFTAETAFEHFSAPFTPRKVRDHMNNITYEL